MMTNVDTNNCHKILESRYVYLADEDCKMVKCSDDKLYIKQL